MLPGPVSVLLDDSYVSKTSIQACTSVEFVLFLFLFWLTWPQDINKGDVFNCTLGPDTVMHISYSRTENTVRGSTQSFAPTMQTTTYTKIVTVHNRHTFDLENVVVRELVPCVGDSRVKVELVEPVGLAGQPSDCVGARWCEGAGEKEGRFEWFRKMEKGEVLKLKAIWEVKAPAELLLVESTSGVKSGGA